MSIISSLKMAKLPFYEIVQFGGFIFGAFCLLLPSGYSYSSILLGLISLIFFVRPENISSLPKEVKILGSVFILYFVVNLVSVLIDSPQMKGLGRPTRALLAASMLPFICRYPIRLETLLAGFATGAIIGGIRAVYDKLIIGMERAFNDIMPIQSGNISMTFGLFSFCGYFWAARYKDVRWQLFMLAGACSGMLGSFLSGTRGGWILLPFIVLTIIVFFRSFIKRNKIIVMSIIFIVFGSVVITPQSGVIGRIETAKNDIAQYVDNTNLNTSLGIRFQLWKSAWHSFVSKPVFGWGNTGIRQSQERQVEQGIITSYIYNFNSHSHNQFLDEMAKRGIIGLGMLLAMFWAPINLVRKQGKISDPQGRRHCCRALLSVAVLTCIDYGLSQAFFIHNSGIVFYTTAVVLITSSLMDDQLYNQERAT